MLVNPNALNHVTSHSTSVHPCGTTTIQEFRDGLLTLIRSRLWGSGALFKPLISARAVIVEVNLADYMGVMLRNSQTATDLAAKFALPKL